MNTLCLSERVAAAGKARGKSIINGTSGDEEKDRDVDDDNLNQQYIDATFARITNHIRDQRSKINTVSSRFRDQETVNKKFMLNTTNTHQQQSNNQGSNTWIDVSYSDLKKFGISIETINNLDQYLNEEDFDSDAVLEDIDDGKEGSNIINQVIDQNRKFP